MRYLSPLACLFALCLSVAAQDDPMAPKDPVPVAPNDPKPATVYPRVEIATNYGKIAVELYTDAAPKTVDNFIGLAEGTKEFKDPKTGEMVKRRYYDGLTFHRVIKNFMLQGGCPMGNGSGNPGYKFADEISATALGLDKMKAFPGGKPSQLMALSLRNPRSQQVFVGALLAKLGIKREEAQQRGQEIEKAVAGLTMKEAYELMGYKYNDDLKSRKHVRGVLSMANSGPNTNGSQFFINLVPTPHLDGKHTVFGKVVEGLDVIDKIAAVEVGQGARPVEPVKIISIKKVAQAEPAPNEKK